MRCIHCTQWLRKIHAFCASGNTLGVAKTSLLAAGCKIPISAKNNSFSAVLAILEPRRAHDLTQRSILYLLQKCGQRFGLYWLRTVRICRGYQACRTYRPVLHKKIAVTRSLVLPCLLMARMALSTYAYSPCV